jgi:hypothetical protein
VDCVNDDDDVDDDNDDSSTGTKEDMLLIRVRSTSRPELLQAKRSLVWAKHRLAHQPVHNCTRTVLVHLGSSVRNSRSSPGILGTISLLGTVAEPGCGGFFIRL